VETTEERDGDSVDPTRRVTTARAAEGEADGDDIVVIPDGPHESDSRRVRRRRLLLAAAFLVAIAIFAAVIALVAHDDGSQTRGAVQTVSPTPSAPVVAKGEPTTVVHKKKSKPLVVAATVPSTRPRTTTATAPRNQVVPPASVAPPPPVVVATTPAPPKQYGTSVLTWNAPARVTVVSGGTATLSVTAHNPTDGTVTLPHPLSCAPRLDHSEMCAQVVQIIPAGGSERAIYTIDANRIAVGTYQLRIEDALTIPVTVTPAPKP